VRTIRYGDDGRRERAFCALFEAAGAGNGADLTTVTGVAQPTGKPADDRPQDPTASEPPRQPSTLLDLGLLAGACGMRAFFSAEGWLIARLSPRDHPRKPSNLTFPPEGTHRGIGVIRDRWGV
jgi:hypothetical protein